MITLDTLDFEGVTYDDAYFLSYDATDAVDTLTALAYRLIRDGT